MIPETLSKIEMRIQESGSMDEKTRAELAQLISTLKIEMDEISKTHLEQAQSIAGFAQISTHEVTRETKNPLLIKLSIDGLRSSVRQFEQSHPRLVEAVDTLSRMLANIGI